MKEKWKWVKGYKGFYKVSNKGRVKSVARKVWREGGIIQPIAERIMSMPFGTHGYRMIGLSIEGKVTTRTIHSLVAHAFLGKCKDGQEVMHIDNNKLNNRASNLRYGSHQCNEAFKLDKKRKFLTLTPKKIIKMRKLHKKGNITYVDLGAKFGVTDVTARNVVKGITWGHIG